MNTIQKAGLTMVPLTLFIALACIVAVKIIPGKAGILTDLCLGVMIGILISTVVMAFFDITSKSEN